jgi:hypothetical protein
MAKPIDTRTVPAAIASYLRKAAAIDNCDRSALPTDKNAYEPPLAMDTIS